MTFELEEAGPVVKLTVVHEGGPHVLAATSQGWPFIVATG